MDERWIKKTKGKTTKECWDLLYDQQIKVKPEGKSVWLPNGNIYAHSGKLVEQLPLLFKEFNIKTFVDVGCSDFYWQINVDWSGVDYLGIDIVKKIVNENKKNHPEFKFEHRNLIEDDCPKADMIFVRNVFLHTSLSECLKMIYNIKMSGSKYLMASNTDAVKENMETSNIWVVRRNLNLYPFNFPSPIKVVPEMKDKENPSIAGKNNYMNIWEIDKL